MSCCWGWVGMTEWYGLDMCGDGHGGLGEWLVNVDEKVTNTTFMLLKCSNCIINSNRTVEVLYFFNDMICMYNLITF